MNWTPEHDAWTRLNARRVNAINRGDEDIPPDVPWNGDSEPIEFINLTTIRERLAPPERLSAMEEARRLDRAQWWHDWTLAVLRTIAIVLVVMLWAKLAMMILP